MSLDGFVFQACSFIRLRSRLSSARAPARCLAVAASPRRRTTTRCRRIGSIRHGSPVEATDSASLSDVSRITVLSQSRFLLGGLARKGEAGRKLTESCASVIDRFNQPRSSHRRLMVESRSPVPLVTKADAPAPKDRCLTSGSFIAEKTMTFASGFTCVI